jgi:hypothetical protein
METELIRWTSFVAGQSNAHCAVLQDLGKVWARLGSFLNYW